MEKKVGKELVERRTKSTEQRLKVVKDLLSRYFGTLNLDCVFIPPDVMREVLTPELAISAVEKAYHYMGAKRDNIQMPSKMYFLYPDGDMRVMPSVVQVEDGQFITGAKVVSVHFKNTEIGLPTVIGFFILVDSITGSLLSVMDATFLTAMRTGASGAVALKYLKKLEGGLKLGIVGCGVQARTQLALISTVADISELLIYDVSSEALRNFSNFALELGFTPEIANDMKEFSGCDVLVTLTPSREPVVMPEHVQGVKLILAMGADGPGKQELHPNIIKNSLVIVDERNQAIHGGEINVPLRKGEISENIIFAELGDVVSGKVNIPSGTERILFDSTGIAILDLFVGWEVFKKVSGVVERFEFSAPVRLKVH